ncbi:TetR/AcrR family transcriptional regulator [Actinoallomurus purpureus]|uniref:TetR/AcrR family transcriptional regulator n=1 Tax=Actinoallomurus purpureus TaxID=478114 RepID=UPI00209225C9|nr:TetR/AcrR family transcriptional regulator [Actinoallomurus purpureus]
MASVKTPVRRRAGQSKGDQREAQILEATRALLTDRGVNDLTIDGIAGAAGISRTTFYFYFPTKQAVVMALLEGLWDQFSATYQWLESSGPDATGLREHHRLAAEVWRDHRSILRCTTGALDYEPLVEWTERAHERFVTGLAAKIERDQAVGAAPLGVAPRALAEIVSDLRDKRFPDLAVRSGKSLEQGLEDLTEVVLRIVYGTVAQPR